MFRPPRRRIVYCLKIGLFMAFWFSAIAIPLELIRLLFGRGTDTPLMTSLLAYWIGAPASGIIVGAMLPLAERFWGALLVGWVGALPMVCAVAVAVSGFDWTIDDLFAAGFVSLIGPAVSVVVRRQIMNERRQSEGGSA